MARQPASREAFTRGLRALADAIDQNNDLPLPYQGAVSPITFHYLSSPDPVTEMRYAMQAIPCAFTSRIDTYREGGDQDAYLYLDGDLHGVKVELAAYRKDTCEQADGEWRIPEVITSIAPEKSSPPSPRKGR